MTIEELRSRTVLELRKLAKENHIVLGAGLSKEGIIEKIYASINKTSEVSAELQSGGVAVHRKLPQDDIGYSVNGAGTGMSGVDENHAKATSASVSFTAPVKTSADPEKPQVQYKAAWHNPSSGTGNGPKQSGYPSSAVRSANFPQKPGWQNPASQGYANQPSDPIRPVTSRPSGYNVHRFGPPDTKPVQRDTEQAAETRRYISNDAGRNTEPPWMDSEKKTEEQPRYRSVYEMRMSTGGRGFGPRSTAAEQRTETDHSDSPAQAGIEANDLLSVGEYEDGNGILELHPDGYGFLRAATFLPSNRDIYVALAQVRRFSLRNGDFVEGKVRPKREGDKYAAMLYITAVNGRPAEELGSRPDFDDLTAVYPSRRICLEVDGDSRYRDMRMIDLIAPLGFGQRGLLLCPPDTGKTALLVDYANAISMNHPDAEMIVLLIDMNPEDVTLFREQVHCQVLASTFDQMPENHLRLTELVVERAMRLVEEKKDVILIVDSLTRLAKTYTTTAAQQGRSVPGMVNPSSLFRAKRLFGAARCMKEGGSLTVIAAMDIETGSKVDDSVVEEFKGTANMEITLDQVTARAGVKPAINLRQTGTKHADILLDENQKEGLQMIRGLFASMSSMKAIPQILSMMDKAPTNAELLTRIRDWVQLMNTSR